MNKKSLQQMFTRKVLPPNIEIKTLYKKASVFENHESNLLLAGNTEWKQVYFTCYSGERCGPVGRYFSTKSKTTFDRSKIHSLKGEKMKYTLHQDVCFVTSQNAQLMKWC